MFIGRSPRMRYEMQSYNARNERVHVRKILCPVKTKNTILKQRVTFISTVSDVPVALRVTVYWCKRQRMV